MMHPGEGILQRFSACAGATVWRRLRPSGEPDTITCINTGRDFDRKCLLFLYTALTMAGRTGVRYDTALAATSRAGLLN